MGNMICQSDAWRAPRSAPRRKGRFPWRILAVLCLCVNGCGGGGEGCPGPVPPLDDGNEPPANAFLADSPWPMSHRNPYCQASSPFAAPASASPRAAGDSRTGTVGLITVAFSAPYPGGGRVMWGSNQAEVFKADAGGEQETLGRVPKEDVDLFDVDAAMSGAYTALDRDGTFFVPRFRKITAYGDADPEDPCSSIVVRGVFEMPPEAVRGQDDVIVGLSMTYDGMLAFATRRGTVGVVDRSLERPPVLLVLGEDEEVSNSVACDETGGIFVVSSRRMHRVQWTGTGLTLDEAAGGWSARYETGEGSDGVRLGAGSGATPTLMGAGAQDRFVAITDGQDLMHIVLFWRDGIPADWVQIPGTLDRRIAAQVPVRFGDPSATQSLSEQSVCVRGYGALVVNNRLGIPVESRALAILLSGDPRVAPYGAEKFQWDPADRVLRSVWVNREISLPSGIPCMSAATNLIYDVGQRQGVWTLEALDWGTGASAFFWEMGPALRYNSAYAATEVGPDGALYSGTLFGLERF